MSPLLADDDDDDDAAAAYRQTSTTATGASVVSRCVVSVCVFRRASPLAPASDGMLENNLTIYCDAARS